MKLRQLLEQLNQLANERPEALEMEVYYSDKFDIINDRKNRSWSCNSEIKHGKFLWLKRKLHFINRVRHLKAKAFAGFWREQAAFEIREQYYNKLKNLEEIERKLLAREIAVLALEKLTNKQ